MGGILQHTALPFNPTYIPTFVTGYGDQMDFWERRKNTLQSIEYLKPTVNIFV